VSALSLILLSTLAGHPPSAVPRPLPVALVGQIRAAAGGPGGEARILLLTKDAEEFELHAPRPQGKEELERLAGVKVRVEGFQNDPRLPRGHHVMVDGYEIVDVGEGVVPELGTIAALPVNGETRLLFVSEAGQAALLPEGWGKKMLRHVGAKVWMVGKRSGDAYRPVRFAILRTAGASEE
jgi:hypothetical protein